MEMLRNLEKQIETNKQHHSYIIVDIVPAPSPMPCHALPERLERNKALSGSAMIAWE